MKEMKDIKGYEGKYAITRDGKVWSYRRKKFLIPRVNNRGYHRVALSVGGERKDFYVHRLVAIAFVNNDNPEVNRVVNHLDENPSNNCASNLEWTTHKENIRYGSAREKISEARKKPVYCEELDKVFDCLTSAAAAINTSIQNASRVCLGHEGLTANGYHLSFVDDNLKQK